MFDHRSMMLPLFVPADRPERFRKAEMSAPDALILDLEDAVAPAAKVQARLNLHEHLAGRSFAVPVLVRINAIDTPWHGEDVAAVRVLPLDAVMMPKAETGEAIARAGAETGLPVVALVESARGLAAIDAVAGAASRIAFGSIDFAVDLAMEHTQMSLHLARSLIVQASRAMGLPAPLDEVTAALDDPAALGADCAHAVEMGFGGKLLIHPKQIEPSRAAFAPSSAQLDWARRVLAMAGSGHGAVRLDGVMIDAPLVARARQIESRASAVGGSPAQAVSRRWPGTAGRDTDPGRRPE